VHKNKTKEDDNKCQPSSSLSAQLKTKKDNDKHQLVIIFSRCIEKKQNKMTTSVGLLSSFLSAHKQKKKR
jgi:hypothetical protein